MKKYTPNLQRDTEVCGYNDYSTEYHYNMEIIPSIRPPHRAWRIYWSWKSFGFAFWFDKYDEVWHPVVKKTYNLVFLFIRIQLSVK